MTHAERKRGFHALRRITIDVIHGAGPRLRCSQRSCQEEGGYEYAVYHHGSQDGKEEAHIEPAVLYQPLETSISSESGSDAATPNGSVLCWSSPESLGGSCREYVGGVGHGFAHRGRRHGSDSIGELWDWVTGNLHKPVAAGVGAVGTVVALGATALATTGCATSAAATADPVEAFDCYKIAAFGASLTFAVAASTYEAWKQEKN